MLNKLKSFFDSNNSQVKKTDPILKKITEFKALVRDMSFPDMRERVTEMRDELSSLVTPLPSESFLSLKKIERGKGLPLEEKNIQKKLMEFLPEFFAFVNEIYRRKVGFEYHDVQLRAGIILAEGQRLVELATGEGKTMTFQLPLFLYSLTGRGAHLVTVNDYLSRRDGEYAGHIAVELGLSVGIVNSSATYKFISDDQIKTYKGEEGVTARSEMNIDVSKMNSLNLIQTDKLMAYRCDITYGTNNEFGFDYLRDNMAWDLKNLSQRELYFCVIDEADSILIDEARTPLIISGVPSQTDTEKYIRFASSVKDLVEDTDYTIDHKMRSATLTEKGIQKVEANLGVENIWADYSMAFHIENAIKAKALFQRDDQYLVRNGEVLIVDEFTGRVLPGRRYSEGLHQAIEAKEGVDIKQESKTFATITFQNFFRLYKVLCGGSGTIMTEAEEFYKIYGLESVPVPTNRPVIRADHADLIYKNQIGKFKSVVNEVIERNKKGQPVLIGTTSVEKSEIVSRLLDQAGIKHEVLNAKYHEQEAKIIELAGKRGAVTVATNMAGRGADIVIGGGRRGDESWKEVSELGGLHVIGTERHEARRIDNQLRGRTGRQGEPGSSRFYVALDDQLMKILGGEIMGRLMNLVGLKDDMPIELGLISRQIETAQKRIEGINFDNRKRVVEYDDVMNQHREIFYARRRNILTLSEESLGKFIGKEGLIDLSLPENLTKKDLFQQKIEQSKVKLKNSVSEIIKQEFETIGIDFFAKNRKPDLDSSKKLLDELLKYVPDTMLRKEFNADSIATLTQTFYDKIAKINSIDAFADFFGRMGQNLFEKKAGEFGEDAHYIFKVLVLQSLDNIWVDHLELMKDIRDGIGLQAYAQKDPLVEYKNRSFVVFESFIKKVDVEVAQKILKVQKVTRPEVQTPKEIQTNTAEIDDVSTGSREFIANPETSVEPVKVDSMVKKIMKERSKTDASLTTNSSENSSSSKSISKEIGRNEKVSVRYSDGKVLKDVKFKKVEEDVRAGRAVIV